MGASVSVGNVVCETVDIFLKTIVPLHGNLNTHTIFVQGIEVENIADRGFVLIQILDKCLQTTFVVESFGTIVALIFKIDANARIQKR